MRRPAAAHDPAIAAMADWLVLLADGQVIRQGVTREVFGNPQSAAAAELLGFENIWEESRVGYAIRAAGIEVAEAGIAASVTSVRAHGMGLRLECAGPARFVVHLAAAEKTQFAPGAKIFLQPDPAKLKRLG